MLKKYLIVIIDDDPDDADLLAAAFTANHDNVAVLTFYGGTDFLQFMQSASIMPSFIITDLFMPITNGIEIIQAIKENPKWAAIPIAIISTSKHEAFAATAMRLGTWHYFIKPATFIELDVIADQIMSNIS